MQALTAVLVVLLAAEPTKLTPKERAYQRACNTGVKSAQEVLPEVPEKDKLMGRALKSCDRKLVRLQQTGQLEREADVAKLACGYGAGALFVKYGLLRDVQGNSPALRKAIDRCVARAGKKGL